MQQPLLLEIELQRLILHEDAGGMGRAAPYLWAVYFSVDGRSAEIAANQMLQGGPTLHAPDGSHGNLGRVFRRVGARGRIPEAIGRHMQGMHPIRLDPTAQAALKIDAVPGFAGVFLALCEEGFAHDPVVGYQAFQALIDRELRQLMSGLSATRITPTQTEWQDFYDTVSAETLPLVEGTPKLGLLRGDHLLGTDLVVFAAENFTPPAETTTFSARWEERGDWELQGRTLASLACPAEVVYRLLDLVWEGLEFRDDAREGAEDREPRGDGNPGPPLPPNLDGMHAFGRKRFARLPGLQAWWDIPRTHMARIAADLMQEGALLDSAGVVLQGLCQMLEKKKRPIDHAFFDHCERLLGHFAESDARELSRDAAIALDLLPALRGRSFRECTEILNMVEPARYPRLGGHRGLEVRPREERPRDHPDCQTDD